MCLLIKVINICPGLFRLFDFCFVLSKMWLRYCTFQVCFICLAFIIHHILCDPSVDFQKSERKQLCSNIEYWSFCHVTSSPTHVIRRSNGFCNLLYMVVVWIVQFTRQWTCKILWNFLFMYCCNTVCQHEYCNCLLGEVDRNAWYTKIFVKLQHAKSLYRDVHKLKNICLPIHYG